jgi:hypothetical protein
MLLRAGRPKVKQNSCPVSFLEIIAGPPIIESMNIQLSVLNMLSGWDRVPQ